ncbi:MAG: enoyl-CoA hydratase/isomerase family protein [Firmicutes bacterium]|nr:enoyl-CoA hydratase/isomerase family protein [Bacillota bacterium]
MQYQHIIYEKKDGLAWITLNRPERMNSIITGMLREWRSALLAAGEDEEVGVVVVTGAGRGFCTGLDLKALQQDMAVESAVQELDRAGMDLIETIQSLPKACIAMVNGPCFTGGLEILLTFDIIIASEEAVFGDTHTKFGITPGWGMSQRLPRIVGLMKAKELSFTARTFTAKEAESLGMVNRVVPADRLREEVVSIAGMILQNSLRTVATVKDFYNRGMSTTLAEGLKIEKTNLTNVSEAKDRVGGFKK